MALMKKMAAVAVTGSLLFGLVGTAFAADATQIGTAANRLQTLGIVNGMTPTGDLQLDQSLTRAQLMKIMVWAYGQKDNAAILKGAVAFPDTSTHWASGEIAIAKNIIVEKNHFEMGMPGGNFNPDGKLTAAQAVAFMAKFLGIAPTNDAWPANYINAAVNAGLITTADAATIKDVETTRGFAFYLADQAFAAKGANGQSVYTTYVKPNAPVITAEASALNTTATKVTVTGTVSKDATKVFVGTPANTLTVVDGNFSFDANLNMGANSIVIGATDIVGATTTKTISVTRTVGEAVAITAPASISIKAGQTADLAVAVKDAAGNVIDNASFEVTSDLGTYAAGKFTAGSAIGTGTATVKAGDLSATVNVTVVAADLSEITVAGAAETFATSTVQKFTATGADEFGNAVELGNITWTATGGVIDNEGNFIASNSGNVVITATAGGVSGTFTGVAYGKAVALRLSTPATVVANGASKTTVTATAVDANGNVDLGFTGTATFSSNNTAVATIDSATKSVSFVNGVATANIVAGRQVGASTISASVSGMSSATALVNTTAQVLTSVRTSVDPGTIAADKTSTTTVKATLLDQDGQPMASVPSGVTGISVTNSNTGVVTGGATLTVNGGGYSSTNPFHYSGTYTANGSIGTAGLTFAITGNSAFTGIAVPAVSVSTTTVSAAYKLGIDTIADAKVGTSATVVVRVYDYNGNQTTGLSTGAVTLTNKADSSILGIGVISGGKATIRFSTTTAGTIDLRASSSTLQTADSTVNFTVAEASGVTVASSPAILNANGTAQSTLTATIVDAYGNAVTEGTYNVTFKKVAGTTTATADFADTTVATVGGKATAVVTASLNNGGSDDFTVSATGFVGSRTTVTSAIMGTPAKLVVDAASNYGAGAVVGSNVKVVVDVNDASAANSGAGVTVTTDNGRVATLTLKDSKGATVQTVDAQSVNGKATFEFTQTTSGTYSFEVTSAGLAKVGTTNVTFRAGTAAALKVVPGLTTLANDGSSTGLTVYVADKYGNTTATATSTTVNFAVSSTTAGALSDTSKVFSSGIVSAGSDSTITYATTSVPGSATITVSDAAGTLTSGTATIDTVLVGDAVRINAAVSGTPTVSAIDAAAAARKYSVITVDVVDASGNRVTSATGTAGLTITSGTGAKISVYDASDATTALTATNSVYSVNVVKGQAKFYVTDAAAETISYSITSGSFATVTGSSTFAAGTISTIVFDTASVTKIRGNGTDVAVLKVLAKDALGNVVTDAAGNVTFSIAVGNDYATLLNSTASFINGEALVSIQAKQVTDSQQLTIKAYTDAKDANGAALTAKDLANAISDTQITVDGKAPSSVGTVTVGSTTTVDSATVADSTPDFTVASAADDLGVTKVVFEYRTSTTTVWSAVSTDTEATSGVFAADWGTVTLANGTYNFRVTVYDAAGNSKTSDTFVRVIEVTP